MASTASLSYNDWGTQTSPFCSRYVSAAVSMAPSTTIHIRDSKTPAIPHLTVAPSAWAAFLRLAHGPGC